jgi:26S proteasome regulatory subunit (ATPase 3-interacting protein)
MQKEWSFGKTAVQRALDQLVDEGTVREKTYGKQKIYFADQSKFSPFKSEAVANLDTELAEVTAEFRELNEEVRKLESEASGLTNEKSVDELIDEDKLLDDEIEKLEQRLLAVKQNSGGVDPAVNRKVRNKWNKYVSEWRKRKRLATGVMDMLLESCPMPKKKMIEEIGIETDEDSKAVLPQN